MEKWGSAKVYEIGMATIGWPPTIDKSAGRQWVTTEEFEKIKNALAGTTKQELQE